jgi:hypothetical protein
MEMDFNKLVHTLNGITEGHNYDSFVNARSSAPKEVKESDDESTEERYDKDGNVKANGAYDAAGHYDAERDADKEDFMSESINKLDDILKLSGLVKESADAKITQDENRPWANSPTEKYLDADTMNITLSGGPNAPHMQVNPNNLGDNPLAMGSLKMNLEKASLNLREDAERIESELHAKFAKLTEAAKPHHVEVTKAHPKKDPKGGKSTKHFATKDEAEAFMKKAKEEDGWKVSYSCDKNVTEQFAAESKDNLAALKAKKAKIDADIEKIVSDGGKVTLTDPLTVKLNKVRADIKKAKKAK